jgi:hypothetical protein
MNRVYHDVAEFVGVPGKHHDRNDSVAIARGAAER